MKLKRASKKVEHLGLEIQKRLYGYAPEWINATEQKSVCFPNEREALTAVLVNGFRPTKIR